MRNIRPSGWPVHAARNWRACAAVQCPASGVSFGSSSTAKIGLKASLRGVADLEVAECLQRRVHPVHRGDPDHAGHLADVALGLDERPPVRALRGDLGVDPVDPAEHVSAVLAVQPLQRHVSDHRQDPVLAKLLQPAPGRPAQLPLPGQPRIPGRRARDPRTVGSAAGTEAARDQRRYRAACRRASPRHDHVAEICATACLSPPAQGDPVARPDRARPARRAASRSRRGGAVAARRTPRSGPRRTTTRATSWTSQHSAAACDTSAGSVWSRGPGRAAAGMGSA